MRTFKNILVQVEDSIAGHGALEQARSVAEASGAALTLARTVEPPQRLFRTLYPGADELHKVLLREASKNLHRLARELTESGLDVSVRLLEGKPFLALIDEVLHSGHDLLVKPADTAGEGLLFGSTDMHLLRKCPCAVWITHPEVAAERRVVALVDPDPANMELNEDILQTASAVAQQRDVPLEVLHAWELDGQSLLASRVSAEELADLAARAQASSARDLQRLLDESGIQVADEDVHLVNGSVRSVVQRFVAGNDLGLIVMGTVSRGGLRGVLIGNTAETILSLVRCPVLTVKPRDFVSPLHAQPA